MSIKQMEWLPKVRVVWEGEGWSGGGSLKTQNRDSKIGGLICWGQEAGQCRCDAGAAVAGTVMSPEQAAAIKLGRQLETRPRMVLNVKESCASSCEKREGFWDQYTAF